jgi:hypothetical protein
MKKILVSSLLGIIAIAIMKGWIVQSGKSRPKAQNLDEVLKSGAPEVTSTIPPNELEKVIEAGQNGNQQAIIRLRTHYFIKGPIEEYNKWVKQSSK